MNNSIINSKKNEVKINSVRILIFGKFYDDLITHLRSSKRPAQRDIDIIAVITSTAINTMTINKILFRSNIIAYYKFKDTKY